ncbi:MAG: P44/Msp2 family outer membrane protein [Pseudomonadota bacterium]
MLRHTIHTALFVLALMSADAAAQDSPRYVKIAAGVSYLEDTRNGGRTTAPFDPGLIEGQLTQGSAYVFETVYDDGPFAALAFGKTTPYGPFRSEVELVFTRSEIARHENFQTLGTLIDPLDAAVLLGQDEPVGFSAGSILARDGGNVKTISLMINFYHDLRPMGEGIRPYWGIGVGPTWADFNFRPGDIELVDDNVFLLGYQAMAGLAYDFSKTSAIVLGGRYLAAAEAKIQTEDLIASDLKLEIEQLVAEIGWQFRF